MRNLGEWICLLAVAGASAAVVSCGSPAGDTSLFDAGLGPDASTGGGSGSGSGSGAGDDGGSLTDSTGSSPIGILDGATGCMPRSCAALGFTCGPNNDGCGGVIDCGGCANPGDYCGGGGYSKCGPGVAADAGDAGDDGGSSTACTPVTCLALGHTCGQAGDGCGGVLDCGSTCPTGEYCGGGGFSRCGAGVAPDGGQVVCTPKTCTDFGYTCGAAGDGCGGALDCGTCMSPQYCGGGGFNTCGGSTASDSGTPVSCTPKTCTDLGLTCGPAGDGCGGSLACGTCNTGDVCGLNLPGVCGNTCRGLCTSQVTCDGGAQTTVTGTVFAGASAWTNLAPDPVPNVLVFVPNAPLDAFTPGASCRQCGADVTGAPLVSTYTDFDGTFTLTNVPAGTSIPIVVQLGRWRSKFNFNVPACASTALGTLNLPRNSGEGNIPLTAISTGSVDALECVLLKMGVAQSEFTADTGAGRIHLYGGDPGVNGGALNGGNPGATVAGSHNEPALMGTGGTFMNYDQIMFPCWGAAATKTAAELANLVTYADSGGHFFATHYSYSWLVNNGEFNNVAVWAPNFDNPSGTNGAGPWTLNVSTNVPVSPPAPRSETFAKWLNKVTALSNSAATVPTNPQVSITNPRNDVHSLPDGGSVDWIDGLDQRPNSNVNPKFTGNGTPLVEHFTFNTPVAASSQCGHAIFSDFHVTNATNTNGVTFPAECDRAFSPQEKILEFMIWDLASCVPPPTPPTCTPITCAQQSLTCGPAGDGCGGSLDCGQCPAGQQCGGGGVFGQCVPIPPADGGTCQPQTCTQQGVGCGPAGNGCGASIDCGPCTAPQTCGGAGVPGQCGGTSCSPRTCAQQNIACGPAGDGCGNLLQCGACSSGQQCGGGPSPGQCGGSSCTPLTCAQLNINCGPAGDGCGNLLQCGTCSAPMSCGGGGVSGSCGGVAQ
jgi:hypothetical protein